MITPHTTLCPSAKAEPGALVIGIVSEDRVDLLPEAIPVTETLQQQFGQLEKPEKHFRFANRCVKSGCQQWHNGRCGVIDLLDRLNPDAIAHLPVCAIRPQCRWHGQVGPRACSLCPFVRTDNRPSEEEQLAYIAGHEIPAS